MDIPATSSEQQIGSRPFTRGDGDRFLKKIEQYAPWDSWAEKLASRKRPCAFPKLFSPTVGNPLSWSLNATEDGTTDIVKQLEGLKKRRHNSEPADWASVVHDWLESIENTAPTAGFALECLAWTHALPRLASRLPATTWWDLFAALLNTANEVIETARPAHTLDRPDHVVTSQLLVGELPLALAYTFPKIEACANISSEGRSAISEGIIELLDGEGMPQARFADHVRELLACWTRSLYLDQNVNGGRVSKTARLQYEWLVRQMLRWRRADGSFMFEHNRGVRQPDGLLKAALEIGGDDIDRQLFDRIRGRRTTSTSANSDIPHPGEHSEWAETAVLRAHWSTGSAYLGVTFGHSRLRTELGVGATVIWSGDTSALIEIDGQPVAFNAQWEEVCWSSDDDVDYIELESHLTNGWRIQRQLLLARDDRFLLSADAIVGEEKLPITYSRQLPLDEGIRLRGDNETCELAIHGAKHLGTILPLALPEWLVDRRFGTLKGPHLQQQLTGSGLYAPIFVDLDSKRRGKPITWRQLTVAEQLQRVPPDVAAAYRVQIGSRQWLIYRSLTTRTNRTFLGQNLTSEFLVARFTRQGELETLIEIE